MKSYSVVFQVDSGNERERRFQNSNQITVSWWHRQSWSRPSSLPRNETVLFPASHLVGRVAIAIRGPAPFRCHPV